MKTIEELIEAAPKLAATYQELADTPTAQSTQRAYFYKQTAEALLAMKTLLEAAVDLTARTRMSCEGCCGSPGREEDYPHYAEGARTAIQDQIQIMAERADSAEPAMDIYDAAKKLEETINAPRGAISVIVWHEESGPMIRVWYGLQDARYLGNVPSVFEGHKVKCELRRTFTAFPQ